MPDASEMQMQMRLRVRCGWKKASGIWSSAGERERGERTDYFLLLNCGENHSFMPRDMLLTLHQPRDKGFA